jgi:hypothetical protein
MDDELPVCHIGVGFDSTETLCGKGISDIPVPVAEGGEVQICKECHRILFDPDHNPKD